MKYLLCKNRRVKKRFDDLHEAWKAWYNQGGEVLHWKRVGNPPEEGEYANKQDTRKSSPDTIKDIEAKLAKSEYVRSIDSSIDQRFENAILDYLENTGARNSEDMFRLFLESGASVPGIPKSVMEQIRQDYNIDMFDLPDFSDIKGVGPQTAKNLETFCKNNDIYTSQDILDHADDLSQVKGVGQTVIDRIKAHIEIDEFVF